MHVVLDHLVATGIGTVVLLLVLAVVSDGRSAAVDKTLYEVHREWSRTLATLVEDDLRNAGAGVPPTEAALVQADSHAVVVRRKNGFGTQPVETVAYRRVADGTLAGPDGPVPAYAVERRVDDVLAQRFTGLTSLTFELRDVDGDPAASLDAGRSIHVEATFGAAPRGSHTDPRSRYRRMIPMPNLALR